MKLLTSFALLCSPFLLQAQSFTGAYVACGNHPFESINTLRFERQLDQTCASEACFKSVLVLRGDSGMYNLSYTLENLGCPKLDQEEGTLSLNATFLSAFGGHWEQAGDRVQLYFIQGKERYHFTLREEGEALVLERLPQPPSP